ncbi:MAG: cysteine desulfurase NifS [Elusimicrobia bacterium]|nr:cysteine desulfurase NifS [Elusimicrobiota bacterium]
MIYMDYNATTPCDKRVVEEMTPFFSGRFGNPSSIYTLARDAYKAIEQARGRLAKLLDCNTNEIFFTSGGTEADNWALVSSAFGLRNKGKHIITSSIEHHAVLHTCQFLEKVGYEVLYLPVDKYGVVDVDVLKQSIRNDTILVSVMAANNEIGTIQPIREIADIVKSKGVYFHTDAVQVTGKTPFSVKEMGVDMASFSCHKLYGPKGVGALYVRKGVTLPPFLHGGGQERRKRAGTENVAGIVGLGKAAEIAVSEMAEEEAKIRALRDRLEQGVRENIPEIIVNGHPEQRLSNTLNFCVKAVEGEAMLLHLDLDGICASSGSACTSGSLEPSHVLIAIGIPEIMLHSSLRFSLGKHNTEGDVDRVLEALPNIVEKLRRMSPLWQ